MELPLTLGGLVKTGTIGSCLVTALRPNGIMLCPRRAPRRAVFTGGHGGVIEAQLVGARRIDRVQEFHVLHIRDLKLADAIHVSNGTDSRAHPASYRGGLPSSI